MRFITAYRHALQRLFLLRCKNPITTSLDSLLGPGHRPFSHKKTQRNETKVEMKVRLKLWNVLEHSTLCYYNEQFGRTCATSVVMMSFLLPIDSLKVFCWSFLLRWAYFATLFPLFWRIIYDPLLCSTLPPFLFITAFILQFISRASV